MHFYNFHIKDYRAKTAHLTPLEHYIYRTLIDWYYLNEKPFESVEQIARYLLLPLTDENHTAINAVLDEFFNYHKGKYHHSRINEEVKDYRHKNGNDKVTSGNATDNATVTDGNAKSNAKNNKKPLSSKERQDRCKKRKRMLNALLDKGITLDKNASFDDVCNAYNANFGNESNETGNASDNESNEQNNGKNGARTINHKPLTINQESERVSVTTDTPHTHAHTFQNFNSNNSNEPSQTPTHHSYQKGNKPTSLPKDFEFSKEHLAKCKEFGFEINTLFEKFKNNCLSKNKQSYNWESEFMLWINREIEFSQNKSSAPASTWSGISANQNTPADPYGGLSYTDWIKKNQQENTSPKASEAEILASKQAASQFFAQFKTKNKSPKEVTQ